MKAEDVEALELMQKDFTDDGKVSCRCLESEFSHKDNSRTRRHIKNNHLNKPKVELDAANPKPPCRQRPAPTWRLRVVLRHRAKDNTESPGAVVEPQVEEAVAVPVPVAVAEPEPDSELTTVTSSLTFQGIKIPDFTEMEIDSNSNTMSVLKRASEETSFKEKKEMREEQFAPTEVYGSESKSTADTIRYCEECDFITTSNTDFHEHITSAHPQDSCDQCEMAFENDLCLKEHKNLSMSDIKIDLSRNSK